MLKHSKTEQRNGHSRGLDQKSTLDILRILNREDAHVASAVRRELPRIARAVDTIVQAFRKGGRLFYLGAGTSGRLAVLDAAEIPPTFGTLPSMVQAIIAGGKRAMLHAVEGAEDSAANGARDLAKAKLTRRDVVVGIAASGTTPYVLGGLRFARRSGAATIGLTSNPDSPLARQVQIAIVPKTGPEAIAGSTRMKAGTAQKMVLNMITTGAMTRLGYVYENLMVNVNMKNTKLVERGIGILMRACKVDRAKAVDTIRVAGKSVRVALVMLKAGVDKPEAVRRLESNDCNVRRAIEHGG